MELSSTRDEDRKAEEREEKEERSRTVLQVPCSFKINGPFCTYYRYVSLVHMVDSALVEKPKAFLREEKVAQMPRLKNYSKGLSLPGYYMT